MPHAVDVQPNRDGSTQVFGQVASVQFCFGGAGGHNALLLLPSLDQLLPMRLLPNPRQQGRARPLMVVTELAEKRAV